VAYFLALFASCSLIGLIVGGYVGYMDATTPPADSPYTVAELATSDVQWTAMVRQYWAASHRYSDSEAENTQESSWQHLIGSAATDGGSGISSSASSSVVRGGYFVHRVTSASNGMQKMVVTP
jgi:hypothetical protein